MFSGLMDTGADVSRVAVLSLSEVFAPALFNRPAAIFAKIRNGKCISFAETDPARIKKRMSIEAMDRALEELEEKSNG